MLRKDKQFTERELILMLSLVESKCKDLELAMQDYEGYEESAPDFILEDSFVYNSLYNKIILMIN